MAMTTDDRRTTERRGGLADALRVEVQLWLAVLFMAIAFGAGVLVHAMAAPPPSSPAIVGSADGVGGAGGSGIFAPPLSDEQVSAGLPADHPDLGSGSDSERPDGGGGGGDGSTGRGETGEEGSSP